MALNAALSVYFLDSAGPVKASKLDLISPGNACDFLLPTSSFVGSSTTGALGVVVAICFLVNFLPP